MSEFDGKKPETKEEFVRLLAAAKEKEVEIKKAKGSRSKKPTVLALQK